MKVLKVQKQNRYTFEANTIYQQILLQKINWNFNTKKVYDQKTEKCRPTKFLWSSRRFIKNILLRNNEILFISHS